MPISSKLFIILCCSFGTLAVACGSDKSKVSLDPCEELFSNVARCYTIEDYAKYQAGIAACKTNAASTPRCKTAVSEAATCLEKNTCTDIEKTDGACDKQAANFVTACGDLIAAATNPNS